MKINFPLHLLVLIPLICAAPLSAQLPGTPIIETTGNDEGLIEKATKLREAGKLLKDAQVAEQMEKPEAAAVELAEENVQALKTREVAEKARKGFLRVGYFFLCKRCDHWHFNLAGGYAVGKDTIASCYHVIKPGDDMREGYLVAVDCEDNVIPVTKVLAADKALDTVILRVEGGNQSPLGLSDAVAVGDPAYCYSFPLGQRGYFSNGIVNRFYWKGPRKGDAGSLEELRSLRVNVSTDWAPGSSGAAIVDEKANVIGHVDTISPLSEGGKRPAAKPEKSAEGGKAQAPAGGKDRFGGATLITLHEAIPARAIKAIITKLNATPPAEK